MLKAFREALGALGLLLMLAIPAAAAVGCETIGAVKDPAAIGCRQDETTACRVLVAQMTVKAANVTIREQLEARTITVPEAERLRGLTKKAEEAIDVILQFLPLENATTADRLAFLESVLANLLAEAVIRQGV